VFGAFHGADLFYVFGSYPLLIGGGLQIEGRSLDELVDSVLSREIGGDRANNDRSSVDQALSEAMMDYWARFAATGDPNGTGAVDWPQYNTSTGPYLELGAPITSGRGFRDSSCDAIATILSEGQ
jgi:carboxylesterase type B